MDVHQLIQELIEQVEDFIINYQCSCVKTKHCPCPRCRVTIEQGQELIERLKVRNVGWADELQNK